MCALFQKKSITNYVSPEITVGFCQYGPTITLGGVVSSVKKIVLVSGMSLSVSVPFHSLKKEFEWFALQSGSASDAARGINIQTPTKFVLSPDKAWAYTILFVDNTCYAEMKNILSSIRDAWRVILETSHGKTTQEKFLDLIKTPMAKELNNMLHNMHYWKTGRYALTFNIATKNDVLFTEKTFSLNDDHIASLKNNSMDILASICDQPTDFSTVAVPLSD